MSTKTFEEGKKFSRRSWRVLIWGFSARNGNEIQTNCRVEFDVKKNKNNKKFPTGNNWIWPSASSIRDLGLWDGLGSLGSISNNNKKRYGLKWSQIGLISESDLNVNEAYSGAQLEKENMKNPSVPRPSLRWLGDQERLQPFWRVGSF